MQPDPFAAKRAALREEFFARLFLLGGTNTCKRTTWAAVPDVALARANRRRRWAGLPLSRNYSMEGHGRPVRAGPSPGGSEAFGHGMAGDHDPYAALRLRDYRCLLAGAVLSSVGAGVLTVAVGWELYQRTGEPFALGLAGLVQFLPVLLLSLPAGHAVDRYSRKHLLHLAQGLTALAAVGLAALSGFHGPVPLFYVCLLLVGCARACAMPARSALLAQIVPAETLGNAVTWNSSGWQVANVAGPALGGFVYGCTGRGAEAYLLTAALSLACAALLAPVRPKAAARRHLAPSLESLLTGVRFVWRTELLLAAITLDLFAVLLGGATALLPVYADSVLHIGPVGLGWLRAAPALGALVMALFLAHRPPLSRAGVALLASVAAFGAATVGFGFSTDPVLSFALLALTGAFDNVSVVVRQTLMQRLTPDEMRGRVAAVNAVFISSSNELGEFESGLTAQLVGPVASVVGGGVGTILVVLAVMLRWPRLLRLGALSAVRPRDEPPRHREHREEKIEKSEPI
ncbi:MAG TPA: MFS transporter [Gemmataceae bacterium]|nr:MFS transporter [Gemmataceae bacterium]